MSDDLRPLIFEMLAAISYLKSKNLIPREIDLERVIDAAHLALTIKLEEANADDIEGLEFAKVTEIVEVIPPLTPIQKPMEATLDKHKICPQCGDYQAKIVLLRQRPPKFRCQACHHEYKWPHRWG